MFAEARMRSIRVRPLESLPAVPLGKSEQTRLFPAGGWAPRSAHSLLWIFLMGEYGNLKSDRAG